MFQWYIYIYESKYIFIYIGVYTIYVYWILYINMYKYNQKKENISSLGAASLDFAPPCGDSPSLDGAAPHGWEGAELPQWRIWEGKSMENPLPSGSD